MLRPLLQTVRHLARQQAYRLRSDQPVTVYQFNAKDYRLDAEPCNPTNNSGCSFTNDASLLLPANALGREYVASSRPGWVLDPAIISPSLVAVTATRDGTVVEVAGGADSWPSADLPTLERGVFRSTTLNRGDVAQWYSGTGDLTGTFIRASEPVQVIERVRLRTRHS